MSDNNIPNATSQQLTSLVSKQWKRIITASRNGKYKRIKATQKETVGLGEIHPNTELAQFGVPNLGNGSYSDHNTSMHALLPFLGKTPLPQGRDPYTDYPENHQYLQQAFKDVQNIYLAVVILNEAVDSSPVYLEDIAPAELVKDLGKITVTTLEFLPGLPNRVSPEGQVKILNSRVDKKSFRIVQYGLGYEADVQWLQTSYGQMMYLYSIKQMKLAIQELMELDAIMAIYSTYYLSAHEKFASSRSYQDRSDYEARIFAQPQKTEYGMDLMVTDMKKELVHRAKINISQTQLVLTVPPNTHQFIALQPEKLKYYETGKPRETFDDKPSIKGVSTTNVLEVRNFIINENESVNPSIETQTYGIYVFLSAHPTTVGTSNFRTAHCDVITFTSESNTIKTKIPYAQCFYYNMFFKRGKNTRTVSTADEFRPSDILGREWNFGPEAKFTASEVFEAYVNNPALGKRQLTKGDINTLSVYAFYERIGEWRTLKNHIEAAYVQNGSGMSKKTMADLVSGLASTFTTRGAAINAYNKPSTLNSLSTYKPSPGLTGDIDRLFDLIPATSIHYWKYALEHDIPLLLPLPVNWPHIRSNMGKVALFPAKTTARTFVGFPLHTWSIDAGIRQYQDKFTWYSKAKVVKDTHLVIRPTAFHLEYLGGNGLDYYGWEHVEKYKDERNLDELPSIMVFTLYPWEQERFAHRKGFDVTGFDDRSIIASTDEQDPQFAMAPVYAELWGFAHQDVDPKKKHYSHIQSRLNTILRRTIYFKFSHTKFGNGTYNDHVTSEDYWGNTINDGSTNDREDCQRLKVVDYNSFHNFYKYSAPM